MIAAHIHVHGYNNKDRLQGQLICIICLINLCELIYVIVDGSSSEKVFRNTIALTRY